MTIKFVACSLLFHLLLFLSASFFRGPESWRKGSNFSVLIGAPDEPIVQQWSEPRILMNDDGISGTRLVVSQGLPPEGFQKAALIPGASRRREASFSPLSGGRSVPSGALPGPADSGTGTKICDNFQASIPVFLCNAKTFFGEM